MSEKTKETAQENKADQPEQQITFEQIWLMAPAFVPSPVMTMLEGMKPVIEKKFNEMVTYPARINKLENEVIALRKLVKELAAK